MNKRQAKKEFRKAVRTFPSGGKSKAGIWLKKRDRQMDKMLMDETKMLEQEKLRR